MIQPKVSGWLPAKIDNQPKMSEQLKRLISLHSFRQKKESNSDPELLEDTFPDGVNPFWEVFVHFTNRVKPGFSISIVD